MVDRCRGCLLAGLVSSSLFTLLFNASASLSAFPTVNYSPFCFPTVHPSVFKRFTLLFSMVHPPVSQWFTLLFSNGSPSCFQTVHPPVFKRFTLPFSNGSGFYIPPVQVLLTSVIVQNMGFSLEFLMAGVSITRPCQTEV